jgi:hypothetical protein
MKKQFLIVSLLLIGSSFCSDEKKAINDYLTKTKKSILDADVKKMHKVAKALNSATRSVLKEALGDDTYKLYRKIYVKEETARWYAGTNKKDKPLSKDEKTLDNSLFKTSNKLEIVEREEYGDIHTIIKKLYSAVKSIIQEYS